MSDYKMVMVEWTDSYGCSSVWYEIPDEKLMPHICISMGWLVSESEDAVLLVPHLSPKNESIETTEQGCGDMTIPKCSIKRMVELKPTKSQRSKSRSVESSAT